MNLNTPEDLIREGKILLEKGRRSLPNVLIENSLQAYHLFLTAIEHHSKYFRESNIRLAVDFAILHPIWGQIQKSSEIVAGSFLDMIQSIRILDCCNVDDKGINTDQNLLVIDGIGISLLMELDRKLSEIEWKSMTEKISQFQIIIQEKNLIFGGKMTKQTTFVFEKYYFTNFYLANGTGIPEGVHNLHFSLGYPGIAGSIQFDSRWYISNRPDFYEIGCLRGNNRGRNSVKSLKDIEAMHLSFKAITPTEMDLRPENTTPSTVSEAVSRMPEKSSIPTPNPTISPSSPSIPKFTEINGDSYGKDQEKHIVEPIIHPKRPSFTPNYCVQYMKEHPEFLESYDIYMIRKKKLHAKYSDQIIPYTCPLCEVKGDPKHDICRFCGFNRTEKNKPKLEDLLKIPEVMKDLLHIHHPKEVDQKLCEVLEKPYDRQNKTFDRADQIMDILSISKSFVQKLEFRTALRCLKFAVILNPRDLILWRELGRLYFFNKHWDDAICCLNFVSRIEPDYPFVEQLLKEARNYRNDIK